MTDPEIELLKFRTRAVVAGEVDADIERAIEAIAGVFHDSQRAAELLHIIACSDSMADRLKAAFELHECNQRRRAA